MIEKLLAGKKVIEVDVSEVSGRRHFKFPYNRILKDDIKSMSGARWDPDGKTWHTDINPHNDFQHRFLRGENPYAPYDAPLDRTVIPKQRFNRSKNKLCDVYAHQLDMAAHALQRGNPGCIIAGEMGTGKTLAMILALEIWAARFHQKYGVYPKIWYCAPRSALRAVQRDFIIWGCSLTVSFMTYEQLVKRAKEWQNGDKPPAGIVYDESSKLKNPQAQRTQAAQQFADGIRADWPADSMIALMSGSPAPKSPADWWSQAEIACPGFIKEGNVHKFQQRLGIVVMKENVFGGGVYPHLVTWKDNPAKCDKCGELGDHLNHWDPDNAHPFQPSVNEILFLYERLKGLVVVFFKKDCLDLPDKTYRVIELKPNAETLRAAKLIVKSAATVIEGLTQLRELSDGFIYKKKKTGEKATCKRCGGTGTTTEYFEKTGTCPTCKDGIPHGLDVCPNHNPEREPRDVRCGRCGGSGEVDVFKRVTEEIESPKEKVVLDLLDEHEDIGRIVFFAGFTGTIDKIVRLCQKQKWWVIRLDQGKEVVMDENGTPQSGMDYLKLFQDDLVLRPRVAFVAHPGSGGMGLTLTASPTICYVSNDFNGDYRTQSEDRIHRPGMDYNLGATIIDIFYLPTDQKVLENLRAKRNLETMSMGELADAFRNAEEKERVT